MGKNKAARFRENTILPNVVQPTREEAIQNFPHKGKWNAFFGNDNPIVLELGCGKGEYSVGLAKAFPEKNFIGIDIKGIGGFSTRIFEDPQTFIRNRFSVFSMD